MNARIFFTMLFAASRPASTTLADDECGQFCQAQRLRADDEFSSLRAQLEPERQLVYFFEGASRVTEKAPIENEQTQNFDSKSHTKPRDPLAREVCEVHILEAAAAESRALQAGSMLQQEHESHEELRSSVATAHAQHVEELEMRKAELEGALSAHEEVLAALETKKQEVNSLTEALEAARESIVVYKTAHTEAVVQLSQLLEGKEDNDTLQQTSISEDRTCESVAICDCDCDEEALHAARSRAEAAEASVGSMSVELRSCEKKVRWAKSAAIRAKRDLAQFRTEKENSSNNAKREKETRTGDQSNSTSNSRGSWRGANMRSAAAAATAAATEAASRVLRYLRALSAYCLNTHGYATRLGSCSLLALSYVSFVI